MNQLLSLYSSNGPELVGIVTSSGEVVQLKNIHPKPEESFDVSTEDLIKWFESETTVATFHTHPGGSSNLSIKDDLAFKNWPNLHHFIVGSDGVREFKVDGGNIVCVSYFTES